MKKFLDRIAYRPELVDFAALAEQDLNEDNLADVGEEIVDVDDADRGGTKVLKKVPCGKDNCSTCPHGPYEYHFHREGDSLRWEYIGSVEEP